MSERQKSPYDNIARRWLALVERREQHFADLSRSGRWRRYYTQTEFLNEMRKVLQVRNQWAALAGVAVKSSPSDDMRGREAAPASRPLPDAYRGRPALTLVSNTGFGSMICSTCGGVVGTHDPLDSWAPAALSTGRNIS